MNKLAALLCLLAAAIHLWVVPEHLAEYLPAGIFFAAVALIQIGAAVALWRGPTRPAVTTVAALAAGLLVVWGLSRTVGLPMGGEWEVEPVGLLDVLSRASELGAALMVWTVR